MAPGHEDHVVDEEDGTVACCRPLTTLCTPVEVGDIGSRGPADEDAFWMWPWLGPLLFQNQSSEARDHCANERTFLSNLRLSVYMATVSVAIVLSFHLKHKPSDLELRMAKPLGAIFWVLSVACLCVGVANYILTVNQFSRRVAIVQTGWKTQMIMGFMTLSIIPDSRLPGSAPAASTTSELSGASLMRPAASCSSGGCQRSPRARESLNAAQAATWTVPR
ncbi:hypothetical protein P8C59_000777 [Phyllachora maydis]|uniref:DUF202 domain-containing protein n=1 Tax=Phyllachora maydis TaxID=1825666 RepID=A0AAD9M849_9PEZI|nr:hypothetical protein P8C59_000777 [Phyllachora maydis]